MKSNKKKSSKILKIAKLVSFILVLFSIYAFYFERIAYLEQVKKWHVDLIQKGESVYSGHKTVWHELTESQKESHRINIKNIENRIKFNIYLIFEHIFSLILNIVLIVSLFMLNRWVKWYLIFWILSDNFILPMYHFIIGYDSLHYEQFVLMTVERKILTITLTLLIYSFYILLGRYIFKLIDIKDGEQTIGAGCSGHGHAGHGSDQGK